MSDGKEAGQALVHTRPSGDQHSSVGTPAKKKSRSRADDAASKRRCVSTACIACRKRKSKCDGNTPSCAACASVYGTGETIDFLEAQDIRLETDALLIRVHLRSQ
jgi:hypothetical protein